MVKNTGKTASPGAIQPLNLPRPIVVEERDGLPLGIRLTSENAVNVKFQIPNGRSREGGNPKQYRNSKFLKVASIEDTWRVDEEWWREKPVSRLYFDVLLSDGRRLTIFKEMVQGKWFKQKF